MSVPSAPVYLPHATTAMPPDPVALFLPLVLGPLSYRFGRWPILL
ncbi:MAG: hypothetical protein ABIP34_14135 [Rhodoferax sp.]